jgi:hypothetical protein
MSNAPKQYVTLEELHKILGAYDRFGSGQVEAGKVEDRLRRYIESQSEEKMLVSQSKFRHELSAVSQKAAIEAKTASQIVAQQVTAELHKTFENLTKKLKDSLLADMIAHVKTRTDDIQSQALSKISAIADASKKDLVSQHHKIWDDLKKAQQESAADILAQSKAVAHSCVYESEKEISEETSSHIKIHIQNVTTIFENFKLYLTEQLNHKLVDKQAVEQKMRDIENDLLARANQIIDLNVQQARTQMESSARAEVREGMKDAATQLIGLLGQ